MTKTLLIATLSIIPFILSAQVLISEVAPSNTGQIQDEDGERPDWMELYNAGSSAVNLGGYRLGDGTFNNAWALPATTLAPGERVLVFASGKNRGNAGTGNSVHHWETIINESESWRYFTGTSQPPANWASLAFNVAAWPEGAGGLGYGDDDDATIVPTGALSVYFRRNFSVADASLIKSMALSIDYDDAFVAYLNGQEIARSGNISGTPTNTTLAEADHEAAMYTGGNPEAFVFDEALVSSLLLPGNNVLAVEIHNVSDQSSDLSGRVWLHAGIGDPQILYGPNPAWFNAGSASGQWHTGFKINMQERLTLFDATGMLADSVTAGILQPGHSRMRINDGGNWCIADTPTPGVANGADCMGGYAPAPVFNTAPGFYQGSVNVSIDGAGQIRYRTDGGIPDQNSALYSGAINIQATTVVRARSFVAGQLPSGISTATYFVNEPTTLPVVSISIPPEELEEVYYSYSRKGSVAVAYFDKNRVQQFSGDFAGWVVGNWSVSFPQKSLQFVADEEYGSTDEIRYTLFAPDKPIDKFKAFRIRNEDDDWMGARMRDRIVNELGQSTHAGGAAFQNVVAFINGEYWGHFNARERLDNYFVRDNHGADPDSITMIKTHWGQDPYQAEYGSINEFYSLTDLIIQNNMADESNFAAVAEILDLENFTDYFATEIYVASTDWLQDFFNNVRLYKASKPRLKWKFLLWDVSYSSGAGSGQAYANVLGSTIANPFGSLYGQMFNSLLENPAYRRYFINRFADLINLHFQPARAHALIDRSALELAPEINRHNERWGTGDSSAWAYNVQVLKDFYSERPDYQRAHILQEFDLNGQVNITLQVNPPGAGHIKISTITPQNLPWTGVYFNGNPVTITAIANPGYTFTNWQNSPFISNLTNAVFTNNITNNATFTANFTGSPQANALHISEINYHSDPGIHSGDWLELRNLTNLPLDVSDFAIQDEDWYHRYTLPAGTVIAPNGYWVIYENEMDFAAQHPDVNGKVGPLGFDLSNSSDAVRLFDRFGQLIEQVTYDDEKPWPCTPDGFGHTLQRRPDSGANPADPETWIAGCIGGSPGLPYTDCQQNLLVSEFNYKSAPNADAGDWIELYNTGNTALDLGGWSIRDDDNGHTFLFADATVLAPGAYLVVYQDAALFAAQQPGISNATGPMDFGLSGDGDLIRVYDANGRIQYSLCFDDASPWDEGADGQGYTLEYNFNSGNVNTPGNWFAGCLGGSPGAAYNPDCQPVAVENPLQTADARVFPNPAAAESVTLYLPGTGLRHIELFDAHGRRYWQTIGQGNQYLISTQNLPGGMYWIKAVEADTQQPQYWSLRLCIVK